jgi:prevent-host-death family protein
MKTIAAGAFKVQCLAIMDEVRATGEPVVITKRGIPVAKVVPTGIPANIFGSMANDFKIVGDIEAPAAPLREWRAVRGSRR